MLIAHFADTHLGRRLYGLSWTLADYLEHFKTGIERAAEEHVDAILFSGDTFDTWRPLHRVVKFLHDTLKPLADRGIRIYAILGEHDTPKMRDIPVHALIPPVRLLGIGPGTYRDCFSIGGGHYCVAGVGNHRLSSGKKTRKRLLERINTALAGTQDARTILMLHQNIEQFFQYEPGLSLSDIPREPIYVAMGHLHMRKIYRRGPQVIAYPGSLDIFSKDELEEYRRNGKGFYLVDLSGDEVEIEKVDLPVIPFEVVEATIENLEETVLSAASRLKGSGHGIIVAEVSLRMDEKTKLEDKTARLRRRLGSNIHLRINKEYTDLGLKPGKVEEAPEDLEVKAITEILGDEKQEELARLIIRLKEALLTGSDEEVMEIMDEIARNPYWDRKIPRNAIRLEDILQAGREADRPMSKPLKGSGGGDLLKYLGGR